MERIGRAQGKAASRRASAATLERRGRATVGNGHLAKRGGGWGCGGALESKAEAATEVCSEASREIVAEDLTEQMWCDGGVTVA